MVAADIDMADFACTTVSACAWFSADKMGSGDSGSERDDEYVIGTAPGAKIGFCSGGSDAVLYREARNAELCFENFRGRKTVKPRHICAFPHDAGFSIERASDGHGETFHRMRVDEMLNLRRQFVKIS